MIHSNASVSVILPCYNAAETIERAIISVVDSTIANQLIVVDDGSIDDSLRKIKALKERYKFTLVEQRNAGLGAARAVGVEHADCDWVTFLDADDVCAPNRLEAQLNFAVNCVGRALIFCGTLQKFPDESVRYKCCYTPVKGDLCVTDAFLRSRFLPSGASMFLSRESYEEIGGFLPENRRGCELNFQTRAVERSYEFYCLPEPLYIQYCTPTSNTNRPSGRVHAAKLQIEDWKRRLGTQSLAQVERSRLRTFIRTRSYLEIVKSMKWDLDIKREIYQSYSQVSWLYRHEKLALRVMSDMPKGFSTWCMRVLHTIRQFQKRWL